MNLKRKENPYKFESMHKWISTDNSYKAFVGFTEDGDIYLTWDSRDDIPVFSNGCKIGVTTTIEDFKIFQNLFSQLPNKRIEAVWETKYQILGKKELYYFSSIGSQEVVINRPKYRFFFF